ncbi:MAG: sulfatase family protein [Planctomycetota bacterium]|jgi:arylsulfatase A-like enzyme
MGSAPFLSGPHPSALAGALAGLLCACAGEAELQDVVLVSIDTLRADALGCYGNPAAPSPGLDALAAEGLRFAEVLAQAPSTAPSHATLFTGLSPYAHRVANYTDAEFGTPVLADELVTLAERFAGAGYDTAAFTDDGPLGRTWRLMAGFDVLHAEYEDVALKVDQTLEYLAGRGSGAPLFLFVHTYQVHQPFLPPPEFEQRFRGDYDGFLIERVEGLRAARERDPLANHGRELLSGSDEFTPADVAYLFALYHAELAYTDRELERLWNALRARERWPDTVLAVTSDHGEEFGEHGEFGHQQVHRETLRVPWILRLPGARAAGTVIEQTVSVADVGATLIDLVGLDAEGQGLPGSLAATLDQGVVPERPSHAVTNMHFVEPVRHMPYRRSLRSGRWALVQQIDDGGRGERHTALFDRQDDPQEASPLATDSGDARAQAQRLEQQLEQLLQSELGRRVGDARVQRAASDAAAAEQMKALGYVEDE